MNLNKVYPSIEEILPDLLLSRVPASLATEITERYRDLGGKYLLDEYTTDGRQVNACMHNDSVQDCLEEVVDAVFNTLVWIFKNRQYESRIPDNAWSILTGLLEIYSLLVVSKADQDAAFSR